MVRKLSKHSQLTLHNSKTTVYNKLGALVISVSIKTGVVKTIRIVICLKRKTILLRMIKMQVVTNE